MRKAASKRKKKNRHPTGQIRNDQHANGAKETKKRIGKSPTETYTSNIESKITINCRSIIMGNFYLKRECLRYRSIFSNSEIQYLLDGIAASLHMHVYFGIESLRICDRKFIAIRLEIEIPMF